MKFFKKSILILNVPVIIIEEILVSSGALLKPYLMTTQSETLISTLKKEMML